MTIVCGIDFSDSSAWAARAAAAMAKRSDGRLVLVHMTAPRGPFAAVQLGSEGVEEWRRERAGTLARELRRRFRVKVEVIVEVGDTPGGLLAVASRVRAGLVVVGALGAETQRGWLLGSAAERVAQSSAHPVLVVRQGASLEAWAAGQRTLRVMVGVELTSASRAALDWAVGLRSIGPCDVQVTHVAWAYGEALRLGLPARLAQLSPEVHAILLRDLQAWAGEPAGEGATTFVVTPGMGPVESTLTALAAKSFPDLLVVGTHQRAAAARLWQGSVSRGVLHQAPCNVACVPRGEGPEDAETLPTFRRVLVPTDFSPLSIRAIPVGYGLVAPGGTVHLLHVASPKRATPEADLEQQLRALIPRAAAPMGVATEVEIVRQPDAGIAIWHAAGRLGVDAICMATHGRSGVSKLILGSQAKEVVQRSRQPVILVPPERAY